MVDFFPQFRPNRSRRNRIGSSMANHQYVSIRALIPNFITLIGLCSGMYAIRMILVDSYDMAVAALMLAAILDGIDGRVARLLKASTLFGAQLDSLADFLNFGVVPALFLYKVALINIGSWGWLVCLVFTICQALRLARFNVQQEQSPRKATYEKVFSVGVPAPAGAIIVLLPHYLVHIFDDIIFNFDFVILFYVLLVSLLIVSTIPTFSGKSYRNRVNRARVIPIFIGLVILISFFLNYPWVMLIFSTFLYWILIPVAWYKFNRHRTRCRSIETSY